jgi:serine/threonine protein kinase
MAQMLVGDADANVQLRRIPFNQIKHATNNFDVSNKIVEGATGEVFAGKLDNKTPVAIKVLYLDAATSPEARNELKRRFKAEFEALSTMQHGRSVRLVAYAQDDDPAAQRPFALLLEFMNGRSLADYLRGTDGAPPRIEDRVLPALERTDVALGLCTGLAFKHSRQEDEGGGGGGGCSGSGSGSGFGGDAAQPFIHRDKESANVGVALPLNAGAPYAELLDFSLAKAVKGKAATGDVSGQAAASFAGAAFTGGVVAGTMGYMATETAHGEHTAQSEAYSTGVGLLELGPRTASEARRSADSGSTQATIALADKVN